MDTERVTVAQALVRFLAAQRVERDGQESKFFGGVAGIFGHGNLAGVGQALLQHRDLIRYYQVRNEQGMVHMATGYAKMRGRMGALACTTSIGPGATNMVTGAATATVNHLPVLLLPSDVFATRRAGAVLQQLEDPTSMDVTVNDSFRAVSRYWDRINRPEQLPDALMEVMRVLTSPADTGAVTLALPQDVQAEAWDFPTALFEPRVWTVRRTRPDQATVERAAAMIKRAERPVIVSGGGTIYSEASDALVELVDAAGIPVGETNAGKGSIPFDHPLCLGALGASGSAFANQIAANADLVIGVGTRYTDFTTASRTLFREDARFVNLNVAEVDALKHAGVGLLGDARESLRLLTEELAGAKVSDGYREDCAESADGWRQEIASMTAPSGPGLPGQTEVVGLVNAAAGDDGAVVCAAGSLPGDLHRLWCSRDPRSFQMEYGYSCMGYEVAGALGAKLADPDREIYSLVGDGSWLMMSSEILTAVQEGIKLTVVLVDNHGFGSIAALSVDRGSQGFGTRFQFRDEGGDLDGGDLPIDLPANARSLGADVIEADSRESLEAALETARASDRTTVIYVEVDPKGRFGGSGAWWDVPVAEASTLDSTLEARRDYERDRVGQARYLEPSR